MDHRRTTAARSRVVIMGPMAALLAALLALTGGPGLAASSGRQAIDPARARITNQLAGDPIAQRLRDGMCGTCGGDGGCDGPCRECGGTGRCTASGGTVPGSIVHLPSTAISLPVSSTCCGAGSNV